MCFLLFYALPQKTTMTKYLHKKVEGRKAPSVFVLLEARTDDTVQCFEPVSCRTSFLPAKVDVNVGLRQILTSF